MGMQATGNWELHQIDSHNVERSDMNSSTETLEDPNLLSFIFIDCQEQELHPWQRSWGRKLGIRKGRIEPQESPWKFSSIYPQNQSLPTLLLCALTYTSDFTGGCPPPPLWKRVNLQLQLIKFLGLTRVFKLSKYRFLWAVKRLIRNCIGEGFFTCWANVCYVSISLTYCVPGSVLINIIGVNSSFNVCNLGPLS